MGQYIKQNTDGSAGLSGPGGGEGQFVALRHGYTATSVTGTIFTAQRRYIVKSVTLLPDVAGTDAGAVSVDVKIAPSGTAIGSGTSVLSATGNLKGTIATNQALGLSATAANLILDVGQSIGAVFAGTLTAAVGNVSVELCPA